MGNVSQWDFSDQELNTKTQQVNRQKSALNLKVIDFDINAGTGVFWDKKNGEVKANMEECECRDFNFTGKSPRKKFAPCMHIYRIAIEKEILEPTFFDSRETARRAEIKLLQEKRKDPSQWGEWNFKIHLYNVQKRRLVSAYDMENESHEINNQQKNGVIHGYDTTLNLCTCPDFRKRRLPCKHIYCLALLLGIPLEISHSEYINYKNEGSF